MPIIFAISFIMELVGGISWGVGLFGIPFLVITGKLPHDITIIAVSIIMVFIGSMLIIGVKDFEREEDNNKIYAFASSFLALASLCVSIVTLLVGKI